MISTTLALVKSLALQIKGIGTLNIVHHLHLVCLKKKKQKKKRTEKKKKSNQLNKKYITK